MLGYGLIRGSKFGLIDSTELKVLPIV